MWCVCQGRKTHGFVRGHNLWKLEASNPFVRLATTAGNRDDFGRSARMKSL
jgi:hypothetical protein